MTIDHASDPGDTNDLTVAQILDRLDNVPDGEEGDDIELELLRELRRTVRDPRQPDGDHSEFVIAVGNVWDGFTAYGPCHPNEITETTFPTQAEWWAMEMRPLPDA